uniref:Helicase C-terminal domain-containing protein n=1 Tax=Mesocestoides corti TaxID=53468 RepID=A0A5K3EX07_MESCO
MIIVEACTSFELDLFDQEMVGERAIFFLCWSANYSVTMNHSLTWFSYH